MAVPGRVRERDGVAVGVAVSVVDGVTDSDPDCVTHGDVVGVHVQVVVAVPGRV